MFSKKTTKILGALVLVGAVAAAFGIRDIRFFAWADDVRQIAQDSYASQITQVTIVLVTVRGQLTQCQLSKLNCSSLIREMVRLQAEKTRLLNLQRKHGT